MLVFVTTNAFNAYADVDLFKYSKIEKRYPSHQPFFTSGNNGSIKLYFKEKEFIKNVYFTLEDSTVVTLSHPYKKVVKSYHYGEWALDFIPGNVKSSTTTIIFTLNKKTVELLKSSKIVKMTVYEKMFGHPHTYEYNVEFEMEGIINLLEIFKEDE